MKKVSNYLLILFLAFSIIIPTAKAENLTGMVYTSDGRGINLRSGAGTSYDYVGSGKSNGDELTIVDTVNTTDGSTACTSGQWYKISNPYGDDNSLYAYACTDYVILSSSSSDEFDMDACKTKLSGLGFPNSYLDSLCSLQSKYPNWNFYPINTDLDFNSATSNESYGGKGLISTSNEGWRSTTADSGYDWETDYWPGFDGASWKAASQGITAYYMDPRNFLNEINIFQFEELLYNPYISDAAVQYALNGTFMSGSYSYPGGTKTYSSTFLESGQINNVNPVFLATRVKQEVGSSGSGSTSGTVSGYEGYYNFFNIGAYAYHYSGVSDPIINGLIYAKSQGWDSPYKSITQGVGGTLIDVYIKKEAATRYFQKYNVNPARYNNYYSVYTAQYMTNIQAPNSEGVSAYNAYKSAGELTSDSSFDFLIPVFNNMGDTAASLPNTGNPNYYLKSLNVNGKLIDGFVYSKADYTITEPLSTEGITIDGVTINSTAKISGTGNITLDSDNKTINIVVTAGNGNQFTYTINVIKEDSENIPITTILDNSSVKYNDSYISGISVGTNVSSLINNVKKASSFASIEITDSDGNIKTDSAFKTGDNVAITSAGETKNYQIVIYGDIDGNGEINKVDLLLIQREVFGYVDLAGIYKTAADVDKSGSDPDKVDLLLVQRQVFGYANIEQ